MSDCCVKGCTSSRKNKKLSFFGIPVNDPKRKEQWLEKLQLKETQSKSKKPGLIKNKRVCNVHFEPRMFAGLGTYKLKRDAYPTIFPTDRPVSEERIIAPNSSDILNSLASVFIKVEKVNNVPEPSSEVLVETTPMEDEQLIPILDKKIQTSPSLLQASPTKEPVIKDTNNLKRKKELSPEEEFELKKRLRLDIRNLKRKNERLYNLLDAKKKFTKKEFEEFVREHFETNLANFVIMQFHLTKRKVKGLRYTNQFKQFALSLYFLGPTIYRQLQETFYLPGMTTFLRMTSACHIASGVNDDIFKALAVKIHNIDLSARDCVICVDELTLKTFKYSNRNRVDNNDSVQGSRVVDTANCALVLMARGIQRKWKQPLAYFFVHNTSTSDYLKQVICQVILRCQSIGLRVRGLITDQKPTFMNFSKQMGIHPENPYFFIDNFKIYYFFDPPKLLKSTRNIFLKHFLIRNQFKIDSKYVEMLFNIDKIRNFKMAPKLTDIHVRPNSVHKNKVSLAAQLFSNTVATSLETLVSVGLLPQEALSTARFISDMNKLFDIFNSTTLIASKPSKRAYTAGKGHVRHLQKMLNRFKKLKVHQMKEDGTTRNISSKIKFIKTWQININSLMNLYEDLKPEIKFICTRHFNQDPLGVMFETIKKQAENTNLPSSIQFQKSFKKIFWLSYFRRVEGSNGNNFNKLLNQFDFSDVKNMFVTPPIPKKKIKKVSESAPSVSGSTPSVSRPVPSMSKPALSVCKSQSSVHRPVVFVPRTVASGFTPSVASVPASAQSVLRFVTSVPGTTPSTPRPVASVLIRPRASLSAPFVPGSTSSVPRPGVSVIRPVVFVPGLSPSVIRPMVSVSTPVVTLLGPTLSVSKPVVSVARPLASVPVFTASTFGSALSVPGSTPSISELTPSTPGFAQFVPRPAPSMPELTSSMPGPVSSRPWLTASTPGSVPGFPPSLTESSPSVPGSVPTVPSLPELTPSTSELASYVPTSAS